MNSAVLKAVLFFFFFSLSCASYAQLKISDKLYQALPDTLKPKHINDLTNDEVVRLLTKGGISQRTELFIEVNQLIQSFLSENGATKGNLDIKTAIAGYLTDYYYYYGYYNGSDTTGEIFLDSLTNAFVVEGSDDINANDSIVYKLKYIRAINLFRIPGKDEIALDLLYSCFDYYRSIKDSVYVAEMANAVSSVYCRFFIFPETIEWSEQILKYTPAFVKNRDRTTIYLTRVANLWLMTIAEDSTYTGYLDSVKNLLDRIDRLDYNKTTWEYTMAFLRADYYYLKKDFPRAKEYIDRAFELMNKPGSNFDVVALEIAYEIKLLFMPGIRLITALPGLLLWNG